MMKKYLCILAVLLFFVLNSGTSLACTGVYIGKEASADGTFILARSNDCPKIFATRMMTVPRVERDSGREMPVDTNSAVFYATAGDNIQVHRDAFHGLDDINIGYRYG